MKKLHGRSTLLGIGIGAAGMLAYLVSCGDAKISASHGNDSGSGTGAGITADAVTYANARSGMRATTVQAALDDIGTSLRVATSGTSTWSVQLSVLRTETETLEVSSAGTVTFVETSPVKARTPCQEQTCSCLKAPSETSPRFQTETTSS